jgi:glycosyltransferase involved in cell wall biosynthesis
MNVLMVTPYYHPIVTGGVETVVKNLTLGLNYSGIKTDVMTLNLKSRGLALHQGKRDVTDGLNVTRIPAINYLPNRLHSPDFNFRINFVPFNFHKELDNYDILHFQNEVDLSFPFFSLNVKKPKIIHCHILDMTYTLFKRSQITNLILKKSADTYITLSETFKDQLIDLGIPKDRIKILPNGINTEKFKPNPDLKTDNLLLFIGRLDEKKGLNVLLESLKHVNTKVHLIIAGPQHNPVYYQQILNLIDKINQTTQHKVEYLGQVSEQEKLRLHQKAYIFLCPSLADSFPMVNLEALSCGTPVIASNVGSISEVVKPYTNGVLVPPGDQLKLASAIQYLLDNRAEHDKMGLNGRKWIVENYSIEVIIQKLRTIYQNLIKSFNQH